MKKFFISVFLLAAVGFVLYGLVLDSPSVSAQERLSLPTATLMSMVESPTAIPPTVTPFPTPDHTLALLNLEAAEKNLQAADKNAKAIVEAANIERQTVLDKAQSDERLAQYAIKLQELENKALLMEQGFLVLGNERLRLHKDADEVRLQEKRIIPDTIVAVGFAVMGVVLLVALLRRLPNRSPHNKPSTILHVPKQTGGTERVPDLPVEDHESVLAWCAAALAGESLALDEWEKAGRFRGDYRKLYAWAVRWGLLMRHPTGGQTVLNEKGERVVGEWMVANPLPHPNESLGNSPPPTVHTGSVHTDWEGEGVEA